jgi:hypothetical protein
MDAIGAPVALRAVRERRSIVTEMRHPMSYFPLGEQVTWTYAVTDPMRCELVTVRVRPPMDIETEDLDTHVVVRERLWVLEHSDREAPSYAAERDHGIEILERCRIGESERRAVVVTRGDQGAGILERRQAGDDRRAVVVTEDLRWTGDESWSRKLPYRGGAVRRYRRAGHEDVAVTAGTFACLKILLDEGDTGTIWLAPEVGIVRSVGAIEGLAPTRYLVLELHSFAT